MLVCSRISYVIILWFAFIFSFVKSSANVMEFLTLCWLLRCVGLVLVLGALLFCVFVRCYWLLV